MGSGHECYEYDTPGWPPYALFKLVPCTGKALVLVLCYFFGLGWRVML